MPPENPLRPEDVEHFRRKLLERRAEVTGDISDLAAELREADDRGASGAAPPDLPTHPAGPATDERAEALPLQFSERQRDLLQAIDEAIERIRAGTYGLCQEDQAPIPRERLEARPWARLCKEHAELFGGG